MTTVMVPHARIFFVFCLVSYIYSSQADRAACQSAVLRYEESQELFQQAATVVRDQATTIFFQIPTDPKSNESVDIASLSPLLNRTAQTLQDVISQCSHTPELCPKHNESEYSPDVLRAAAELSKNIQAAEVTRLLQALTPCWGAIWMGWRFFAEGNITAKRHVERLMEDEIKAAKEHTNASCGFICGRKCACRTVQTKMAQSFELPKAHAREVCSQQTYDLVMELRERILNELDCSEFGDYVKDFGPINVNFLAKKTRPTPKN